ncbi:MAG: imidazole glycerol phosphate synthase subunit HisH [Acidimicrobiales bacterium]
MQPKHARPGRAIDPIGVVDYAAGNCSSVLRALRHLSLPARAVVQPRDLDGCSSVVLPGVGSAGATMRSLQETGLAGELTERVGNGLAYVGICIGLQVLFEHSEEDEIECLGWLPGRVRRLPEGVRVPQIGWNLVTSRQAESDFAAGFGDYFYFVNSYVAEPADPGMVAAEANYGGPFVAAVHHGNIFATQFHLEKSGAAGLRLLRQVLTSERLVRC